MDDNPLSVDEFRTLATSGFLRLPADRDNVEIHEYLTRVRGWTFVWTTKFPDRVEINAKFE